MADFELFNGTNLEEPDSDHRIAMNKPSLAGAFFVRWDNFKNLIRSFTVSKDTDQSISGNKTFTGIVNVQAPTSDNNPVTLKYFNDNAGGGEEIIEVATYADLPLVGVISVLYVVLDDNVQYRWSGTVYVPMSNPLSYASQAEMELAEPIENTKVVTPLRAWQGFVYWCKNTLFPELNTSDKTIIGSVNELKTNVTKLESNETPASIADTDNVRFKSATGYYVRTLLAIKKYVKLGLKASEVVNDSTNVTGPTVKAAFDNATLAIDGATIQDADLFPIAREVEAPAGVFTSVNMYHTWDRIKNEIKDTCGTYYIDSFDEFKTIVEDPLTPSDSITFYLSNDNVFIMVGTITCHTENIYVKSQNTSVYLATLTINTTLIDTPNRIYFDGVCRIGDTEITITIPSETTTLFIKELAGDELYPSSLNILKSGAGYLQYNNATNISRSFLTNFDQYQAWDAIRQDEKWAYSHFRTGSGLDAVGKTIAKVTGISDAYGNFSIKVRYRLCYNETDLVLPLFPTTLPHGKWVRFERCDYCRDKGRGDGGIYVTPRGFEVAKFYKGDSDLVITYGVLSNEAGAGGLYENQYDDSNTYFQSVVRATLAQATFKVKYTDSVSTEDNDTWVIVHLRGVIL